MANQDNGTYNDTTDVRRAYVRHWLGSADSPQRKRLRDWLAGKNISRSEALWMESASVEELNDAIEYFAIPKPKRKIGLALSGGGFRASIFHLGVIRRLEELGIMKDVDVISTVSGGSIVGAYYICEMELRLKSYREQIECGKINIDNARLKCFDEIASDFLESIQHNMRTRALVFSPFFHPILFIKSLWPKCSRSDLIQEEYDRFLFYGNVIDQLPSTKKQEHSHESQYHAGPKLILNATSLLDGQRKGFSREPISGINEMRKVNRNVTRLSRVVGASAGVPGLFPPTIIGGNAYVDGGVSDNQGLDGLLDDGCTDNQNFDLLIISDASGQLEQIDDIGKKALTVLQRTMSVFQHEIRNKELQRLCDWKKGHVRAIDKEDPPSFAFFHLFLNLKDKSNATQQVPSEYIPALGRIRTDLDQFSMIECEALMYHGYTLIDAQLRHHCSSFLKHRGLTDSTMPMLHTPPLFNEKKGDLTNQSSLRQDSTRIKKELVAGSKPLFLWRVVLRHGFKAMGIIFALWFIPLLSFFIYVYSYIQSYVVQGVRSVFTSYLNDLGWVGAIANLVERIVDGPALVKLAAWLFTFALINYILAFITYIIIKPLAVSWDRESYRRLTNSDYKVSWS